MTEPMRSLDMIQRLCELRAAQTPVRSVRCEENEEAQITTPVPAVRKSQRPRTDLTVHGVALWGHPRPVLSVYPVLPGDLLFLVSTPPLLMQILPRLLGLDSARQKWSSGHAAPDRLNAGVGRSSMN
jgi:hypothetical protein